MGFVNVLVDASDIFYFFLLWGGRGSARRQGVGWIGGFFLLKIPGGGGFSRRGRGPRGRHCVCGELGDLGGRGGGAKYFFSGPNVHQDILKWVQKWVKSGFWVRKWVRMGQNPLFYPLETRLRILTADKLPDFLNSLLLRLFLLLREFHGSLLSSPRFFGRI